MEYAANVSEGAELTRGEALLLVDAGCVPSDREAAAEDPVRGSTTWGAGA